MKMSMVVMIVSLLLVACSNENIVVETSENLSNKKGDAREVAFSSDYYFDSFSEGKLLLVLEKNRCELSYTTKRNEKSVEKGRKYFLQKESFRQKADMLEYSAIFKANNSGLKKMKCQFLDEMVKLTSFDRVLADVLERGESRFYNRKSSFPVRNKSLLHKLKFIVFPSMTASLKEKTNQTIFKLKEVGECTLTYAQVNFEKIIATELYELKYEEKKMCDSGKTCYSAKFKVNYDRLQSISCQFEGNGKNLRETLRTIFGSANNVIISR